MQFTDEKSIIEILTNETKQSNLEQDERERRTIGGNCKLGFNNKG